MQKCKDQPLVTIESGRGQMGDLPGVMPRDLGRSLESHLVHEDAPYGMVQLVRCERADLYWIYTTEHTDHDALADILSALPDGLELAGSEPCKGVPPEFAGSAQRCTVTYMVHREETVIGADKTQFLAAQGIRFVF